MKLAVVSDIHGNLLALQAVVEDIRSEGVDHVLNLGDILSGPLQPAQTADYLMARDWITIAGNHERQLLQAWDAGPENADPSTSDGYAATQIETRHAHWLRSLPPTVWLGEDVLLVHGTPVSDAHYWLEEVMPDFGQHGSYGIRAATGNEVRNRLRSGGPDTARAKLALCGHSHVPRVVVSGTTLIVNPGSVGVQAYFDGAPHYHQVETGSPHARYAIIEQRAGAWQARLIAVAYDWAAASVMAASRGRREWAYALTTGRNPAWASAMRT
ncbi:MAG TPA: metallophosphoesterase family protein [Ramlibacter sp.]|uniref:metallophosphoesterase family protein n=1 Tax=Ramlibacter sp. TaxID=1917967 RepID=UPI002C49DEBD|nr:metallophosphoesterase family protein [Ramlibacter sp.]HVZ42712.1 metallophosphoesterase family protein [Ramlibacter sp.]